MTRYRSRVLFANILCSHRSGTANLFFLEKLRTWEYSKRSSAAKNISISSTSMFLFMGVEIFETKICTEVKFENVICLARGGYF